MHLNFPEIESRVETEMLVPQGIKMKEITTKKKTTKKPSVVVNADETDEEAMARFAREHPVCVQAELEHIRSDFAFIQKFPELSDVEARINGYLQLDILA